MTTNRNARNGNQTGILKTALVVGSLVATVAGTRLLAAQEAAVAETAVSPAAAITVMVPVESSTSSLPLPPNSRGTQVQLQAIPQAVQPHIQPVVRARSSR